MSHAGEDATPGGEFARDRRSEADLKRLADQEELPSADDLEAIERNQAARGDSWAAEHALTPDEINEFIIDGPHLAEARRVRGLYDDAFDELDAEQCKVIEKTAREFYSADRSAATSLALLPTPLGGPGGAIELAKKVRRALELRAVGAHHLGVAHYVAIAHHRFALDLASGRGKNELRAICDAYLHDEAEAQKAQSQARPAGLPTEPLRPRPKGLPIPPPVG